MKVLVKFNKNISTPKQVRTFKVFDLGVVTSTLNNLLNDSIIEIDDLTLPILKIKKDDVYNYYLINDLGKTNNFVNPYYTDDFTKDINLEDLISINTSFNDVITKHSELILDDGTNPHGTTKSDIGLNNVDNTSDLNKPISIATQNALNLKANINDLSPVAFSNNYNDLDNIPNNLQSLDDVLNIGNYSEKPATVGDFNAKSIQVGNDLIPEISGGLFKVQKNADGTINLVLDSVSHTDSDNFGRLTSTLTNNGGIIFRHLENDNSQGAIVRIRKDGILFTLINSWLKVNKDGVYRDVLLSGLAEIADIIGLQNNLDNKADLVDGLVPQAQSQGSTLTMDPSTYKIEFTDARGEIQIIDLPIESLFKDANYNSETKKLILTLDSGDTIEVSLEDLVDLPEIQIENINPSVSPSDGKKVYFNISNGKIYLNYQNEWAFLGNAISDTEKANITTAYNHSQATGNPHGTTATDVDALKRDGSNANSDVNLGNNNLSAKGLKVNGTAGSGHLGLKHQSTNATAGGQETALFAGSDGELYYKNDSNALAQIASRDWVNAQNYITNVITALGFTPENSANKSTSITTDSASNTKYPSVKAVFDWANSVFTTSSAVATQITTALVGYATQAWVTSQGYLTSINSSQVTTALGYEPMNDLQIRRKGITIYDDLFGTGPSDNFQKLSFNSGSWASSTIFSENNPGVIAISSSSGSTNGGGNIVPGSTVAPRSQAVGVGMQFDLVMRTSALGSNIIMRFGIIAGTVNPTQPTDGVYFTLTNNSLIGQTANSSVRSSTAAFTSIASDTWYHFRVTMTTASLATYELYDMDGTLLWTDTLTTNLPTIGTGIQPTFIAYNTVAESRQLAHVDYISYTYPPMNRGALT